MFSRSLDALRHYQIRRLRRKHIPVSVSVVPRTPPNTRVGSPTSCSGDDETIVVEDSEDDKTVVDEDSETDDSDFTYDLGDAEPYVSNGRRFPQIGNKRYLVPCDEQGEQSRMHCRKVWDELLREGLAVTGDVLLIGSPTDANDVADKLPGTKIVAVTVYSGKSEILFHPNVEPEVDDVDKPWVFSPDRFGLVQFRDAWRYTTKGIGSLSKEAYKTLKPGGFVKFLDVDFPTPDGSAKLVDTWRTAIKNLGFDSEAPMSCDAALRAAGFENVTKVVYLVPVKPSGVGSKIDEAMSGFLEDIRGLLQEPLLRSGWSAEKLESAVLEYREALYRPGPNVYCVSFICTIGQKPTT